jgi:hypothetical protein
MTLRLVTISSAPAGGSGQQRFGQNLTALLSPGQDHRGRWSKAELHPDGTESGAARGLVVCAQSFLRGRQCVWTMCHLAPS